MYKIQVMCNTSPIIGLMAIGRLSLLWELFETVYIPEAVYDELCADTITHQDDINIIKKCITDGKLVLCKVDNQKMVESLYGRLHFGELEVIIGAKEKGVKLAVIDDLAARKMANDVLLDTIGILGILVLAKSNGLIKTIKEDVDKLRESGYRISDKLYFDVLKRAGEANS